MTPYYYAPRGSNWVVYRYLDEKRQRAEKVAEFFTKAEARAEVYRRNGWKGNSCFA